MLRFNHYMKLPAVKTKQKTQRAVSASSPGSCDSRVPVSDRCVVPSALSLRPSSSLLFKKEVDPSDFSPCIKQETIINM